MHGTCAVGESECGLYLVLTGSGVRPEDVLGLVAAAVLDVEEDERVALEEEVVGRPLQRLLAARREVHRHADLALAHRAQRPEYRSKLAARYLVRSPARSLVSPWFGLCSAPLLTYDP